MSYLCSYYKVSIDQIIGDLRITPLPYIRQISCYFLIKHFDWTIYEVRDYIECERTMVMHNVQKIVDLVDVDRTVLKDVLAHRDWLEKLNKV
jgi:chromosomal replication initiation ATPase DnaA